MIRDTIGKKIIAGITPAKIKELHKQIVDYVDKNSEILLTLDMSTRYSFDDADRKVIYDFADVTEELMITEISRSKDIYSGNKIHSNPFYVTCILTMYALLKKNDEKTAQLVMTYMSLMMYVSAHKGSFKYNANKQIIDYTLAHLDNSFIIRKTPSIYSFIDDNAVTAFTTYKLRIITCKDSDITWVTDALWTRIKGKLIKIANAYYENHKSGNYLNADTDSYTQDDYHEMDSDSYLIDRLSSKIYIKLINHQFDKRFIRYSITQSDTSYQKLVNIIDDIIGDDENNDVKKVLNAMIEYYLLQSGKSADFIARGDFIAYMKTAYASNTELEQMVFIKSIIDRWLEENMYKYGKANYGKTVKQQYRKSLYMFFIFIINYEAKTQ